MQKPGFIKATISKPIGSWCRKLSRSCRLIVFLSIALGTFFLPIIMPRRLWLSLFLIARISNDSLNVENSRFLNTASNSADFNSRWLEGKDWSPTWDTIYWQGKVMLRWKSFTTFSATSIDNVSAAFRSHSSSETMSSFAFQYARLKRSFHISFQGGKARRGSGILNKLS